jgi:glycosyltransferase involved in cell wall biosynthesis
VTETFSPEINGVAMTLGRITEALLHKGHMLQIVRPSQGKTDIPRQLPEQHDILVAGFPIPFYSALRFGITSKSRLIKLWKQNRPDIVHVATEGPLGLSAIYAARKLNLPITSSFHTNFQNYTNYYGIGFLKKLIDAYLRWFHNQTMATLVPTPSMVHILHSRGYKNVSLFSRGVAIERFSPAFRSSTLRESWGVTEQDIVVLHVGRLAKEKNINLVLRSFSAIQSQHTNTKLVFVGDGPLRKSLQEVCPNAIFTGMKTGNELASHYASGDLFLFPSITETFGNVVPEALASGLAVVAYDYAAAAQLIVSESNGLLVPFGDEASFVKTALTSLLNLQHMQAIRQEAPPSVAHLKWDVVCDRFLDTLYQIVECHTHQQDKTKSRARMDPVIQSSA